MCDWCVLIDRQGTHDQAYQYSIWDARLYLVDAERRLPPAARQYLPAGSAGQPCCCGGVRIKGWCMVVGMCVGWWGWWGLERGWSNACVHPCE